MLSETDKTEYRKIVEDLNAMATRLADLSDGGYSDMEGADMPEFSISEELYCLGRTATHIKASAKRIEEMLGK